MSASQQKKVRQQQREEGVEKRQLAQKKAIKKQKRSKATGIIAGILAIVLVAALIIFNSPLFYRHFAAVKIGDESYSAAELSFFYKTTYYNFANQNGQMLQMMGLNPELPLDSQEYTEGQTWADFFRDAAIESMKNTTMLWSEAQKAGFKMSDEEQAALDANLEQLKTAYEGSEFKSADKYIAASYGRGCNVKLVSKLIEKSFIAQAYSEEMQSSFTYSPESLAKEYETNADNYDKYTYISYLVDGSVKEEPQAPAADGSTASGSDIAEVPSATPAPTEEEAAAAKAEAMAAAKETADKLIADVETADDFSTKVLALKQAEAAPTTTSGSQLDASYADWLKDAARTEGDKTVIETETGYQTLYFISRDSNDYNTVSARHILSYVLPNEAGEYTDEAKAEGKKKAEDILAEWKSGDATEDSFAKLANEKSDDTGSNTKGGLYESFAKGQMVKSFDEWCYDEARKPGDTGIVFNEGSYCGYHAIYFVGTGDNYRDVLAENALRGADYTKWETEALKNYTSELGFTAKLVK
ncbi:MAG: peptidylprolyl isomerase [Oscillospiraceae bacterium]